VLPVTIANWKEPPSPPRKITAKNSTVAVETNDQQQRACEPDEDHVSLVREETGIRIGLLLGP
jgi:hypothetical protein